jgi:two-component system response regulator (stage 0 sporulation protein A)
MSNLERKVNAMIRLQLAQDESEKEAALAELKRLSTSDDAELVIDLDLRMEEIIHELLKKAGCPAANLGHKYLVYGIKEVVKDPGLIDRMVYGFYPKIAQHFDTTATRAERAVRHSIECAFMYGSIDEQKGIFGNSINPEKGKVVVSEFVARLANIVRIQLRKTA